MPIQSPAKDLRRGSVRAGARNGLSTAQRKTFAGALFGQGREKVSEQPTGRPRKALQRSVRCCWSCFAVFRSIWAKNKGSTRYTDAPLVREMDTCTRPEGARGSVRAMPEHNTCRDGLLTSTASHLREMGTHRLRASVPTCVGTPPVTDEHRTNCNTRSPRRFRSCCNRGLPYGNQSEPVGSRR